MERNIVHLRVDSFPIAVERLADRQLMHRPVVICARHSPRSLIYAASPEARAEGVHELLPLNIAFKRCRQLIVLPPNEKLYRRASDAVQKTLHSFSPLVEPGSWGRFFVDLSGTSRLYGPIRDTASRIQKEITQRLCLSGALGVASNKLVSGVAARVAISHGDLYAVPTGNEASFLAPLKAGFLPAVRYKGEQELLAEFNIRYVWQLAALSLAQLASVFGKRSRVIHRQALGIDWQPVLPPSTKSFVLEECTLDDDTNDDHILLGQLYRLTERACARMRRQDVVPRTVWLHIRYSDGMDASRRLRLEQPEVVDPLMFDVLQRLFMQTDERRQRVRFLSITFSDLVPPLRQLFLFREENAHRKEETLVAALDVIREKFGMQAVKVGRTAFFK